MNRSTSNSPFEFVYGFHPRGIFELRELKDGALGSGYVEEFIQFVREVHENVR